MYNCLGNPIPDRRYTDSELALNDSYVKSDGYFNWPEDNGFDKRYNIAGQGHKASFELPKGKAFVRYGNNWGRLLADKGVPYELLGLPYKRELKEYHEYILKKKITIEECGYIAPVFDSPGGIIQYYVKEGIQSLIDKGVLEEDKSWLKTKKSPAPK